MVQWFAFAVSLLALGVSAASYWSGKPRLKVTAQAPVGLLGMVEGDFVPAVIVEVTNDGGRAAQINSVRLHGGGVVGKLIRGSTSAVEIKPGGDKRTWIFDYSCLRDQLGEQARTEFRDPNAPLMMRATVAVGRKQIRSNLFQVNPPGIATAYQSRTDRWRRRYHSWRRPSPMILGGLALRDEHDSRSQHVTISNSDRGVVSRGKLVLVVERQDGSREQVTSVAPVPTPRVWGRRSRNVEVPLMDDSMATDGDSYSWVLEFNGRLNWGQPAHAFTLSEARETRARYAAERRRKETGSDGVE